MCCMWAMPTVDGDSALRMRMSPLDGLLRTAIQPKWEETELVRRRGVFRGHCVTEVKPLLSTTHEMGQSEEALAHFRSSRSSGPNAHLAMAT